MSRGRGRRTADGAARGHAGAVPAVLRAGAGYYGYIVDILDISTVIDSISRHPATWCAAPAAGGPADTCSAR